METTQDKDKPTWPDLTEIGDLDPNPVVGKCSKCGLELRRVMGYYCSNNPCPAGLGSRVTM